MRPRLTLRHVGSHIRSVFRSELLRRFAGAGTLKALSVPLTMAASVMLARGLGPEGFGNYAFVMSLVAVVSLPIGPGLMQLVTREVASYAYGREWALVTGLRRSARVAVLSLSGLCMLGALLLATLGPNEAAHVPSALLPIGALVLPALGLTAVQAGTIHGLGRVVYAQVPKLLVKPGGHVLIVAFLLVAGRLNPGNALLSQVLATLVGTLAASILLLRLAPTEIRSADPAYRRGDWAQQWLPFTLLAASGVLNAQLGILVLGLLGSSEGVAALRVADRGAALIAFPLMAVNMVIAPQVALAAKSGTWDRLQALSTRAARIAFALAIPIAMPMFVFPAALIRTVFGADYAAIAAVPLGVLAIGQLVSALFGPVGTLLTMSGHASDTLLGQGLALVANALVAVVLVPSFGALGAAIAASVGLVASNGMLGWMLTRRLRVRPTAF